ncbi:membrane protein [Xenorhabdus hominickii]|nr:membrane protein [Xenorhabdus hominickii]
MMEMKQQDIVTKPIKKSAVKQPIMARVSTLSFRAVLLLFVPYLLVGCAKTTGADNLVSIAQSILPEHQVTDYRLKNCDSIWDITKLTAMENGLYWLRFMDCTDRLPPSEAREVAKRFSLTDWEQVFKQSILINKSTPSLAERRKIVENLNRYGVQFPVVLRPLLQLWREQQYLKINLAEEKMRFQRFQFDSDSKIDRLKETRTHLENELRSISRKLENLTDIERQLSSRKQDQSNVVTSGETGNVDGTDSSPRKRDTLSNQLEPEDKSATQPETQTKATSPEEKGAK